MCMTITNYRELNVKRNSGTAAGCVYRLLNKTFPMPLPHEELEG